MNAYPLVVLKSCFFNDNYSFALIIPTMGSKKWPVVSRETRGPVINFMSSSKWLSSSSSSYDFFSSSLFLWSTSYSFNISIPCFNMFDWITSWLNEWCISLILFAVSSINYSFCSVSFTICSMSICSLYMQIFLISWFH